MSIRIKLLTFILQSVFALTSYGEALSPENYARIKAKAEAARTACSLKIHFDTHEFENCIDNLSHKYIKDDISRLGTEYAGFAVSLSTTRVGMSGAEATARHFYKRYQPIQAKLEINDLTLCAILPGNCIIRVAQTQEFQTISGFQSK